LEAVIKQVHADIDATYGKRRMLIELQAMDFKVGIYKVSSLMKRLKLVAKRPKQHRYPEVGVSTLLSPLII